nr:MAG TPA: hypothetical protein [Caudoviricetes sp.]
MPFRCQKLFLSSTKQSARLDGFCVCLDARRAESLINKGKTA